MKNLGKTTIRSKDYDGQRWSYRYYGCVAVVYDSKEEASQAAIRFKNVGAPETAHLYESTAFPGSYFAYYVHSPRFESEGNGFINFHSVDLEW